MMRILMAATAVLCLIGSSAEARSYHHHHTGGGHHYSGRPAAWCGWYMRGQVSAATPAPRSISPGLGPAMGQMPVALQSVLSSSGVTTSARSSARRTAIGSCRVVTTATPFGRVPDRWLVQSRFGGADGWTEHWCVRQSGEPQGLRRSIGL